jgi:GNAT superfamily N-acetyltransferase
VPYRDRTAVDWIVAAPDHADTPDALRGLLDAIGAWGRAQGCTSAGVGGRWPFGVGWGGIPTCWRHVLDAFVAEGFLPDQQWVIMTRSTAVGAPAQPALGPLTFRWHVDEAAQEWELRAFLGDELAGECQAWGIPRHLQSCPGADEWITVEWIGVEEPYQRKGLGRWLMLEQLRHQAARGVRHVALWTERGDAVARRFYETLGFTYGPECWKLVKTLP